MTGSMSKYVPHLRELAPTTPFLSSAYGATEGMFGVQAVRAAACWCRGLHVLSA